MGTPTQATRHIAIETPLGEDVLLLQSFSGHEEISRLFEFDLHLLSEDYEINPDDIIGQNVTVRLHLPDGGTRYWNGHINRFIRSNSTSPKFAQYRASMVPWLWFLTRTSDCRIFQGKTVLDIVKQVFSDLGFTDIEERLTGSYRTWTYCVQYRETDFNFVSRLMEQEGIYYYFLHENGKCTIVLCDSPSVHDSYTDYDTVKYSREASSDQECITEWSVEKCLHAGKFAHTDYNFEKPGTSLMSLESEERGHAKADYEIYDPPGEFLEKPDGEQYAKVRMEELARSYELCNGRSDCRGICPGYLFTLQVLDMSNRFLSDQAREYMVISADYQASAEDYETSGGMDALYGCFFLAIPSSVQFRPARITPKPVVEGSQTAVVTGPSGEEIYTDPHGRIKVQFHWDREGKRDENSSCWIRVSQAWAGDAWGAMHIPRIGQEVIISFIEGDPDRPVITGRLYNADKVPPYELPNHKNISTIKSRSTPQDSGYNELRFDDTSGSEQIYLHAQGSRDTIVRGSWRETTGNEKHETVKSNKFEKVEGNVENQVGGYSNSYVNGLYQLRVEQDISLLGHGNMELYCPGSMYLGAETDIVIKAMNGICIYYDSSNFITIDASGVTIKGTRVLINSGGSSIPYAPLPVYGEEAPTEASSGRPPQEPSDDSPPTIPPVSQPSQSTSSTMVSSATTPAPSSSSSQSGSGGSSQQSGSGTVDTNQPESQEQGPPPSPSGGQSSQSTQSQSSPDSGGTTQRGISTGADTPSEEQGPQSTQSQSSPDSGGTAQRGISTGADTPSEEQGPQSTPSQSSSDSGGVSRSAPSSGSEGPGGGGDEEMPQP